MTSKALSLTEEGFLLPQDMTTRLDSHGVWAILISNDTGTVIWKTESIPDSIPTSVMK